jgi:plasmid stabilization system protein ParE
MRAVEFLLGARADFDESFDWYAKRSVTAAMRFAGAVDAALISLAANPSPFASPDGVHRECPVKAFPFRVVYRIYENQVLVVAIAHVKRRPGYWQRRR